MEKCGSANIGYLGKYRELEALLILKIENPRFVIISVIEKWEGSV